MIIFRYLAREVLITMTAVSASLLFIFMSGRFVKYLAEAAAGEISGDILFSIMLFRMPAFLELILPLGFFLGILLGLRSTLCRKRNDCIICLWRKQKEIIGGVPDTGNAGDVDRERLQLVSHPPGLESILRNMGGPGKHWRAWNHGAGALSTAG